LANGAYLALAWISGDDHLDTNRLLHHGAHPLTIAIYCLLTLSIGYIGFRRSCIRVFLLQRNKTSTPGTSNQIETK
jgi:hypothetical protein